MIAKKAPAKKAAKKAPAKKAAKKASAKKAAGGTYIGTFLMCSVHGVRYPRGAACPRCL
jgi:hypothetical protein